MSILESATNTIASIDVAKAISTIEEGLAEAIALTNLPKEWARNRLEVGRIVRLQQLCLKQLRERS